ncbi:hypothetical protein [Luteimonas terrae]|uniref:DUF4424 domain-containing protein n=1 Tax=Luteimonas terrae TaxID=1530191 RepID=A0ABU1Y062_9GAMM|nr:hypothetical protein [Luteimonas terrae]MDR7193676.1 hypothetical protein [Luteimonas terrae]
MLPSDSARAHVDGKGVALEAVLAREGEGVRVDYRIRNTGTVPLVVFDRGDRHAVLTRRQPSGAVGVPALREHAGMRATLSHVARALPTPAPTVPPTPLARRIAPGAHVDASFGFSNWFASTPALVQWCVGIGIADDARLFSSDDSGDVEVWQADFGYADDQQVLCTPWFDMANGTFER